MISPSKIFLDTYDLDHHQANQYFITYCENNNDTDEISKMIATDLVCQDTLDRAFIETCRYDKLDITRYLLDNGANLNALEGMSIVRAVRYCQWPTVDFLLKSGIRLTTYNIVHTMYQPDNRLVLRMMLDHNYDRDQIAELLIRGLIKNPVHIDSITTLINEKVDLNQIFQKINS